MRPQNWPDLLATFLAEGASERFEWGTTDCALWACAWIAILTGTDHAESFRGTYDSEQGAALALGERGYASLQAIADDKLAACPVPLARRGDIVMHSGQLGVCNGRLSHFLAPVYGLTTAPTLECERAWRVD